MSRKRGRPVSDIVRDDVDEEEDDEEDEIDGIDEEGGIDEEDDEGDEDEEDEDEEDDENEDEEDNETDSKQDVITLLPEELLENIVTDNRTFKTWFNPRNEGVVHGRYIWTCDKKVF